MRDQKAINAKIAASLKGKAHPHVGVKHSAEARAKISEGVRRARPKLVTKEQRRAQVLANTQAYYCRRRKAIPSDADMALISVIYAHCPKGYHVDHRKSLGEGGPHHQDNLQYLPSSENIRKGKNRKYDETLVIRWQDTIPQ